ncbi:MAG: IMP dehydrogenase [bacterium]
MSVEKYIPNPYIPSFFKLIRTPKEKDSYLQQLEQQTNRIMGKLDELREEKIDIIRRYPQLDVDPNDQFALTPFDKLDGLEMIVPPEVNMRSWEIQREENLTIANHPARLYAMNQLEQRGFIPPPRIKRPRKKHRPIDKARSNAEILWLSDLGQARQLRIKGKEAKHPQVHRTPFLAVGPLSFVGDRARSFIGIGAMSDITGSVLAGVTLSKMHVSWFVSKDGKYANPDTQAKFIEAVVNQLNNPADPLLQIYSAEEKQQIIDRWISCMVVSTEANPDKALRRFEAAFSAGARSVRPYQHTAGIEVVQTTKVLKKEYQDDIEIFASQISSTYIAEACEDVGASAGIIGVGSGGRCITAQMAALVPTNAHLPWELRGKLKRMPILAEGGAINNPVVSALIGISGVLGSGSLGGGTFEAPGGIFFFSKDGGKTLVKPYRGEASHAFKYLGNKTYPSGYSFFREGEGTFREFDPFAPSITSRIRNAQEAVIVGASDLGLDGNNPDIIGQMQRIKPSPLFRKTHEGTGSQNTH